MNWRTETAREPAGSRLAAYLALAYTLLIAHASLFPFSGWRLPADGMWAFLFAPWPRYYTRFDIVINFLAYFPLGFLIALAPFSRRSAAWLGGAAAGLVLSFSLEALQSALPGRISSNLDLLSNTLGGACGALGAAWLRRFPRLVPRLRELRRAWFRRGGNADFALVLLALWFFVQANPTLPLFGNLFVMRSSFASGDFSGIAAASVLLNLSAAGLLLMLAMHSSRIALAAVPALALTALALKLLTAELLMKPAAVFPWLSVEAVFGSAGGLTLLLLARFAPRRLLPPLGAAVLALEIAAAHIVPERGYAVTLRLFGWHYGQLANYASLTAAVAELWPFLALIFLWRAAKAPAAEI